jgi:hypothetical protein
MQYLRMTMSCREDTESHRLLVNIATMAYLCTRILKVVLFNDCEETPVSRDQNQTVLHHNSQEYNF